MDSVKEKQLRSVKVDADGNVKVRFVEIVTTAPEHGDGESTTHTNVYTVESPQKPHKDLPDTLKKLRKPALELWEINADSKEIHDYNVIGVKIDGDVALQQSRVQLILAKDVKRTGKLLVFPPTPQVTMYGESEYEGAEKMAAVIEDLIEEVWSYLNGTKVESSSQLALFPMAEMKVA